MTKIRLFIVGLVLTLLPIMAQAQQPVKIEYFLDSDPGHGLARSITDIHVGGNQLSFDVSDAPAGAHVLYVRSQDSDGHWSTTMSRPLYVEQLQDIAYVEYFIDDDPGRGQATPVALPQQDYKAHLQLELELDVTGLSLGEHELSVRAYDVFDQWTDVMSRRFTVVKKEDEPEIPVGGGDLSRIEYFFDTDPGYGHGYPLEKPSSGENTYLMSFANIDAGFHLLCLRAQDDANNWSSTMSRPIYVIEPTGDIEVMEYFFDSDPGEGNGTAVELPTDASEPFAFQVPVEDLSYGIHKFYVRVKDSKGKWSLIRSATIEVIAQTGIEGITTDESPKDMYDLQGHKVTNTPHKGVYILGGKKVLVK